MNPIDIRSFPLSSKASVCWGFFWRGIVVSLGSAMCGGILGGIVGVVFGLAGATKAAGVVGALLVLGCGAFFIYVLVRWLLASKMGGYRLVLIGADDPI